MDYILFIILVVSSWIIGLGMGAEHMQDQAIEHGYAQHNPITGDWEWIKKGTQ